MAEAKKVAKTKKIAEEAKEKQIKHAEVVAEAVPVGKAPEAKIEVEQVAAKAGKRSTKAQREEAEKEAKRNARLSSLEKRIKRPSQRLRLAPERSEPAKNTGKPPGKLTKISFIPWRKASL